MPASSGKRDLNGRASVVASAAVAWSVVEATLAFIVGTSADSAMFIALAHAATVDIMPGLIGKAQISALASGERFAFNDRKSEALAFAVTGTTSIIAAGSVTIRAIAHFHATPADVSPAQKGAGVLVAVISAVVLYLLARAKRRIAEFSGGSALLADANGTVYSAYVAMGVFLTSAFDWLVPRTPLDPVVALAIAVLLVWQGIYGVRTGIHIQRHARSESTPGLNASTNAPK